MHENQCGTKTAPVSKFSIFSDFYSYTISTTKCILSTQYAMSFHHYTQLSHTIQFDMFAHWGKIETKRERKKNINELNDNLPVLPKSVPQATPVFVDLTRLGSVPFLPQHLM